MESYLQFADLAAEIPEVPPDSIVSRTVFSSEQIKAILFGFAAGQELSEHTSSHPAILHFLKGSARLTLGEDVYEAKEGTWVHMPPNLQHSVVAQTPVTMLLLLLERPAA